jgi:hypothetical protein
MNVNENISVDLKMNNSGKIDIPFSKKYGHSPLSAALQIDSMNNALKVRLWNHFYTALFLDTDREHIFEPTSFDMTLWSKYLRLSLADLPSITSASFEVSDQMKEAFDKMEWYEIYDLVEFVAKNNSFDSEHTYEDFIEKANTILAEESAAYRFVEGCIAPITSQEQREQIEMALLNSPTIASMHLKKSLELLSDKKSPDYVNSMKESITAVEAICKLIAGKENADLSCALKIVERRIDIPGALQSGLSSLYGYTSSYGGIRHASIKDVDINLNLAVFFLSICSAFVNYLNAESSRMGIDLSSSR